MLNGIVFKFCILFMIEQCLSKYNKITLSLGKYYVIPKGVLQETFDVWICILILNT